MSRAQRFTFLAIAVVIAVIAVILLSSAGGGDDEVAATPTAAPTATAEAGTDATATPQETPEATPTPKPQPPLIGPGKVTELEFKEGDQIVFLARADGPEEVHVHGYDIAKDVDTEPVRFSFPATITGIFEIELENSGEQIAELRVDPK
jgi:FtsP/CotA-like multicopper oxidase with cupredoxin domain